MQVLFKIIYTMEAGFLELFSMSYSQFILEFHNCLLYTSDAADE